MRLVTCLVFLLLAVQRLPAQLPAADTFPCMSKLRFVVIGSSTAAGAGASKPDSAWVNRYRVFLQALHPANEVLNLAMGGYSSYQLMPSRTTAPNNRPQPDPERNITRALSLAPDAIILNLPSNDAASGYSLEEQLANFETIVQQARNAGVPIWVCSTQPRNFSADKVQIQLVARDSILRRYGDRAIDVWKGLAEPNGLLRRRYNSGDGIHLNDAGHRFLFQRVCAQTLSLSLCDRLRVRLRLLLRVFRWS